MGMGRWTRANAELCLLATKGKPKRISAAVHSVVESPLQAHSEKPAHIRDLILKLVGDLPRIELFARDRGDKNLFGENRFDGWDTWGNEVKKDITL